MCNPSLSSSSGKPNRKLRKARHTAQDAPADVDQGHMASKTVDLLSQRFDEITPEVEGGGLSH